MTMRTTSVAAARLKPGVTLDQAKAQLKLAHAEFKRKYPDADPDGGFSAEQLKDAIVGDARNSLLVLIGAVSFVLLIACANVANLLMVRAAGRKREFAIRAAYGLTAKPHDPATADGKCSTGADRAARWAWASVLPACAGC